MFYCFETRSHYYIKRRKQVHKTNLISQNAVYLLQRYYKDV